MTSFCLHLDIFSFQVFLFLAFLSLFMIAHFFTGEERVYASAEVREGKILWEEDFVRLFFDHA